MLLLCLTQIDDINKIYFLVIPSSDIKSFVTLVEMTGGMKDQSHFVFYLSKHKNS